MSTLDLNAIKAQLIHIVTIADAAEYSTGAMANQRLTQAWATVGANVPELLAEVEQLRVESDRLERYASACDQVIFELSRKNDELRAQLALPHALAPNRTPPVSRGSAGAA